MRYPKNLLNLVCEPFSMKKFIISGLAAGAVILVLWNVVGLIFGMFGFSVSNLAGMRNFNDPIMMLYFLYPFVFGFALAYLYPLVEGKIKGDIVSKGFAFGMIMFTVNSIPSAYLNLTSMDYPFAFTAMTIIGPLVYLPAAGIAVAWASKLK
jgi:hypothetical protein